MIKPCVILLLVFVLGCATGGKLAERQKKAEILYSDASKAKSTGDSRKAITLLWKASGLNPNSKKIRNAYDDIVSGYMDETGKMTCNDIEKHRKKFILDYIPLKFNKIAKKCSFKEIDPESVRKNEIVSGGLVDTGVTGLWQSCDYIFYVSPLGKYKLWVEEVKGQNYPLVDTGELKIEKGNLVNESAGNKLVLDFATVSKSYLRLRFPGFSRPFQFSRIRVLPDGLSDSEVLVVESPE